MAAVVVSLAVTMPKPPVHVANVRQLVVDALTPEQVSQLAAIADAILHRLDPDETMSPTCRRYDTAPAQSPAVSP